MRQPEVILTLTTIGSRLAVVHRTVESLLQQRCSLTYDVRLNVSREPYLLDDGVTKLTTELESLRDRDSRFKVTWVQNTGPYRKLIPVLEDAIRVGADPILVTCDDDVLYPANFLETLIRTHLRTNSIVAYRGYTMQLESGHWLPYELWQRSPKDLFSIMNLPTGKDGILYRASHFDERVIHSDVFVKTAPTADDIWFKWHTALRAVPVYLLSAEGAPELPSNEELDFGRSLYSKFNKAGGNDAVVNAMESLFAQKYNTPLASTILQDLASERSPRNQLTSDIAACLGAGERSAARRLLHLQEVARNDAYRARGVESESAQSFSSTRRAMYRFLSRAPKADKEPIVERHARTGGIAHCKSIVSEHESQFGWLSQAEYRRGGPRISIVMTTFNSADTVEWSVRSALDQDYSNREVIVVDDNSRDNTWEILQRLETENPLLRVFRTPSNRGTYFCKNIGLLAATGDFFTFQDSDDLSHPARIRLQLWHLTKSGCAANRCSYVRHHASRGTVVPVNGAIEKPGFITLMLGRDTFRRIGFFDCARKAADDELICRLKAYFGTSAIAELDLPLYVALYEEGSLIADSSNYDPSKGLTFQLSDDRAEYLRSFTAVHKELIDQNGEPPARYFAFPPARTVVPKPKSMRAFEDEDLPTLASEVEHALGRRRTGRMQSAREHVADSILLPT